MDAGSTGDGQVVVRAWRVHDSGLAPAPPRFRRLGGSLRHHQGHGPAWPDTVELVFSADALVVPGVGRWPRSAVAVEVVQPGPPVTFVVRVPGSTQLLATGSAPHVIAALESPAPL